MITEYYACMERNGVRVINHSFGNNDMLTQKEYGSIDSRKNVSDDFKKALSAYANYEDYYAGQKRIGESSAKWLMGYMLAKLINGQEDFLYVQSAGNGSMLDGTPVSSDLNLYFCSMTEDMFNEQVHRLQENSYMTPERTHSICAVRRSSADQRIPSRRNLPRAGIMRSAT